MPSIREIATCLKERFAKWMPSKNTGTQSSLAAPIEPRLVSAPTSALDTAAPATYAWPFREAPPTLRSSQFAYTCPRCHYRFSPEASALARRNGRHLECPNCLRNDTARAIDTGAPCDSPPSYTFDAPVIDLGRVRSVDDMPSTPPMVSGGGGDYAGAGASGSWEPDVSSPAPAPAPSYDPPAASPSYDSSSSSGDSGSSSSSGD